MAGWRRPIELAVNDVEVAALEEISRSRSEPAIRAKFGVAHMAASPRV
jgi:hypothetical protein